MCSEPAGEHGWKTQLSVRLGAGREVRASLPALPLGAERAALLSAALGGGCIDQGQRSCVIKGGPGIKGALPQDSRVAPQNPRPFTPLVSSDCLIRKRTRILIIKLTRNISLSWDGFQRLRIFRGRGWKHSFSGLLSQEFRTLWGRHYTCLPFLRKKQFIKKFFV